MEDFRDLPDRYVDVARDYAPVFASAKMCKDKLKQKLAVITAGFISEGMSVAKSEAKARASEEYRIYLVSAQDVLLRNELGRSELKGMEMAFEMYRSLNSLEKKKINLL